MTPAFFVDLATRTLHTTLLLAAPPLLAGLVVGVVVSIFQAITQMQEQTLVLVPKILVIALVLLSNVMKNIGMIETTPNIVPAMSPLAMFVIGHFLYSL